MIQRFAILVVLMPVLGDSTRLPIGPFLKIADGIWDAWNSTDPQNVRQGRFGMQYGNGKLWLVSRRLFRKDADHPWDPASRGGIVSTLRLSTNAWTHNAYDRLDDDQYGDKLFSLNGRLFMLTYGMNRKVSYHKLFFWDDDEGRWLETPFDIDPAASTINVYSIQKIVVNVPKQDGKTAYFIASSHQYANRGSEMAYAQLDVDFRGNVPIKASLKSLAREESTKPSAVFFTALKDNKLMALIENFYSEGYVPEHSFAYTLDLSTKAVGNVTLTGPHPPMNFEDERIYQSENELFLVGGSQTYGLGQMRSIKQIWSLDLSTFQWRNANVTLPDNIGDTSAFDQQHKKLYIAGLKEGVSAYDL